MAGTTWSNIGFYTYLLLDKNADPRKLEAQFPDLVEKYIVPETVHDMGETLEEARKSAKDWHFYLMPLTDIHLYSHTKYEIEANGDIQYVYIFGALAVFILLLACVNFTNLSTASSARRSREVGIRKVLGSVKGQLISQFLVESVLISVCAMLLALAITWLLLPLFNQLSGKHFSLLFFLNWKAITAILGLSVVVGILAGIYPSFFLSAFRTIAVLKGGAGATPGRRSFLRSGLVVFQFMVSTALIIATLVVYQQLHYMQNKKLGYDRDQVMMIEDTYALHANQFTFKQELQQDPRVEHVTVSRDAPVDRAGTEVDGSEVFAKDKGAATGEIHAFFFHVDCDYLATLGMEMASGRYFSPEFKTDSTGVVINEAAVRELGWKDNNAALNKIIVRSGQQEYKVIGVVKDFNYTSAKQKIAPLMMMLGPYNGSLLVKIKTGDVAGFIADTKQKWARLNTETPFSYYFLDDRFASLYTAEQKTGQLFTLFAIVAGIIACLGLFGLVAFTTQQRTKEIGIRKVLGASVPQVLLLLSKEFLFLVGVAFLIAVPLTWWTMLSWLNNFAYRIHISWWVFLLAGVSAILVALITVSFQTIRAALTNPVKNLREE
jgi:putative ABC transport system permease protein